MKNVSVTFVFFELLVMALAVTFKITFCDGNTYVGCVESEKEALLRFKQDVKDPSNRLASWVAGSGDCCKWVGVVCNNLTGHVLELHLRNPLQASMADFQAYEGSMLVGKINPSLVDLKHLMYLDLSYNDFEGIQFPEFLGSMRTLRYLNLSRAGFGETISNQLSGLSDLQYLDLQGNGFRGPIFDKIHNFTSLRHLDLSHNFFNSSMSSFWGNFSNLEYLSLGSNDFLNSKISRSFGRLCNLRLISMSNLNFSQEISEVLDILSGCVSDRIESLDLSENQLSGYLTAQIGKFKNLRTLFLSENSISGFIPWSLGNLSSLKELDLSLNKLEGSIPQSLGELSSLESLDLSNNKLNGSIPSSLGNLSSITKLHLYDNELSGLIPPSLGELSFLTNLYLFSNNLVGPIPSSFGELSSLKSMDLSYNKLNGTLSEIHFSNLIELSDLSLHGNSLSLKVNHDWTPPFQLQSLYFGSCHLGPQFPSWIYSQMDLGYLDISNSGIVGTVPSRFWRSSSQYIYLNLSGNHLNGVIPNLVELPFRASLDFSSNNFSGPLPYISSNVTRLDFSNNSLSGSIFQFLCDERNVSKGMKILNLRDNFLNGELPDCWTSWELLEAVYLDNNKLIGNLPVSMGSLSYFESLHLRGNSLYGTIPTSLGNCTQLQALDLGENEFFGTIPMWMGEKFSRMMILSLRSNKFHGPLPLELCHLDSLQILDLASNNLSGTIPRCFNNFSAMVTVDYSTGNQIGHFVDFTGGIIEDAVLIIKGTGVQFRNTLNLVRILDLSSNNFSGEIPEELTNLKALQSLNLSHNVLVGRIPESMGAMRSLEAIDFSKNQLSGEIPRSLSELNFLSRLDISDNNLTGEIPSSTQLQSLDASSFVGNDHLCGPPLPKLCSVSAIPKPDNEIEGDKDEDEQEIKWFYVSMALGFVGGFWIMIVPLNINTRWGFRYCNFLDNLVNKLCRRIK